MSYLRKYICLLICLLTAIVTDEGSKEPSTIHTCGEITPFRIATEAIPEFYYAKTVSGDIL